MKLIHVAESQATVYNITCCDCQAKFTGETRRVMNVWLTELKRPLEIASLIVGPLNNQDDDSDSCTSSNEKQAFCTACKRLSHYHTFHYRSRLINDVKWPFLQWCGRLEKFSNFSFLNPRRSYWFNFRLVFQGKRLGIIEKWLQKRELTFWDEVLAVVNDAQTTLLNTSLKPNIQLTRAALWNINHCATFAAILASYL